MKRDENDSVYLVVKLLISSLVVLLYRYIYNIARFDVLICVTIAITASHMTIQ